MDRIETWSTSSGWCARMKSSSAAKRVRRFTGSGSSEEEAVRDLLRLLIVHDEESCLR